MGSVGFVIVSGGLGDAAVTSSARGSCRSPWCVCVRDGPSVLGVGAGISVPPSPSLPHLRRPMAEPQ